MGDRTTVTLTIPRNRREEVAEIYQSDLIHFNGKLSDLTPEQKQSVLQQFEDVFLPKKTEPVLCFITFEDINYGELHDLHLLEEKGIAYDSDWANGDEYDAGCRYCRFDDEGNLIIKELYETSHFLDSRDLVDVIDDHDQLKKQITDRLNFCYVMPFDVPTQEANGKRYRVKQLITPRSA